MFIERLMNPPTPFLFVPALVSGKYVCTYGALAEMLAFHKNHYAQAKDSKVGVILTKAEALAKMISAVFVLESLNCDVELQHWPPLEELNGQLQKMLDDSVPEDNALGFGAITFLTSGTTGPKKRYSHRLDDLLKLVKVTGSSDYNRRWFCGYQTASFAWFQVLIHSLYTWSTFIMPSVESTPTPKDVVGLLRNWEVNSISLTPSLLKQALLFSDAYDLINICPKVEQITLGGEPTDEFLLKQVDTYFPDARLTQIYASTEYGRMFSVHDGKPGFPKSYLYNEVDGKEFRVSKDFVLEVRFVGQESVSLWMSTGDVVREVDNRIRFCGRIDDEILVCGVKVLPLQVEEVLRKAPGVLDVRVYGHKNELTGAVVAAEVVIDASWKKKVENHDATLLSDTDSFLANFGVYCDDKLPRHFRPVVVKIVDKISLTQANKASRVVQ